MILVSLLNDSTTFIGTLTTLVVLCIVSKGNFIHEILEELKSAVEGNIKDLKGRLLTPMVLESEDYEEFTRKVNSMSNPQDNLNARNLSWKIRLLVKKFDSSILATTFKKTQAYIDEAHNSREQFLSPHYSFLFCLLLFLCDEIVCYADSYAVSLWVGVFLVSFITYSYILLSAIWIMYIKRFGLWCKADSKNQSALKDGIIHFDKFKAIFIGVPLLLLLAYLFCGRSYIVILCSEIQWKSNIFTSVIDIVFLTMPIYFVYVTHENAGNSEFKRLSYNFTFVHFIFGGILSLAVCAVIFILWLLGLSLTPSFLHIPSDGFIKWGSIVLIIFYGLVCPSYLPYAVFCKAEKNAKNLIESTNQIIKKESDDLLESIRNFNLNH